MSARCSTLGLALVLLGACCGVALATDSGAARATLSWKAKDDGALYGYLVYRADSRDGPFRRINRDIVHVVPAEDGIAEYTYVDSDVAPGRTYYYYLDTLGRDGRKQRFSGVVAKTVAAR